MAEKYQVHHRAVSVYIRRVTAAKNGVRYSGWEIRDYSTRKLVRHQRATLAEAKAKAKEVCECLATGKREVLEWDDQQRFSIRQALRHLEPSKTTIDRACAIFAEAAKIIPAEEIVAACRAWHDKRPNRRLVPKRVSEAVPEFLNRRVDKVSERRYRTDRSYLGMFQKAFAGRWLHEVTTLEIKDWAEAKGWKPKTKNDAIGLVRSLYGDAIDRGYAVENPAKIKREPLGDTDVGIFTPGQAQRILNAVEDRLKPFFALLFFSGLRKEEASRLNVAQVREGLRSGSIYLNSSIAKTNRNRAIALPDNLKAWLTRYLPVDGPLLPKHWQTMERLDELGSYAERKSGVKWVYNGPRHSFGTYHLRLYGDPAETVKQMGNSLVQLDGHYSSRAESVTREAAQEHFAIMPSLSAEVVPLPAVHAA
jgi:integrase